MEHTVIRTPSGIPRGRDGSSMHLQFPMPSLSCAQYGGITGLDQGQAFQPGGSGAVDIYVAYEQVGSGYHTHTNVDAQHDM